MGIYGVVYNLGTDSTSNKNVQKLLKHDRSFGKRRNLVCKQLAEAKSKYTLKLQTSDQEEYTESNAAVQLKQQQNRHSKFEQDNKHSVEFAAPLPATPSIPVRKSIPLYTSP